MPQPPSTLDQLREQVAAEQATNGRLATALHRICTAAGKRAADPAASTREDLAAELAHAAATADTALGCGMETAC